MTNQDICSESSVSGDGETRTLTPLLAPDPKSGVSTFHHTPINPGFIYLKETKETLAKNLQDPQSLRIRNPFNNMVNGRWEREDSNLWSPKARDLQSLAIATMRLSQISSFQTSFISIKQETILIQFLLYRCVPDVHQIHHV